MAIPTQTIMPSPTPSNLRKRSKETPPSGGRTAPPPSSVQSILVGSDDTSPRTAQAEVVALAGIAALRRGLSVKVKSEDGEENGGGVVCVEMPGDDVVKGETSELSAAGALLALVAGDERKRGGAGGGGGLRDGGGGRPKKRARQLEFSPVSGADSARNGGGDSVEHKGANGKRNGGVRATFDKTSSGTMGLLIVTSDLSAGSPMSVGSKGRICNCKNSRCLKLYCEMTTPHQ